MARKIASPLPEKYRVRELTRFVSSYVEVGMRLDKVLFGGKYMETILSSYEQHSGTSIDKEKVINLTGAYLRKKAE